MKVIRPLFLFLVCALLLATGNQQARQVITNNKLYFEEKELRDMIGDMAIIATGEDYELRDGARLVGHIRRHTTPHGYNGDIALYVARTMDRQVLGVRVIRHRETPGLGDKINRRISDWTDQFNGRTLEGTRWDIRPTGDLDGITGATITSRAVITSVREVLAQ